MPNNDVKTLFGKSTQKVTFDNIKNYSEYVWKGKKNDIHGTIDPVYQYIYENYQENDINVRLKTWALDIEVFSHDGKFPYPEHTNYQIDCLSIKCFKTKKYYVLSLKDYDKTKNQIDIDPKKINFKKCEDEKELLKTLITLINKGSPDILTGWNCNNFDFPYIINRCEKILSKKETSKLSPFNKVSTKLCKRKIKDTKTNKIRIEKYFRNKIDGIILLDYMELYKKYTFEPRESFKLDFICTEELGEGKVDYSEFDGLHEMWRKNPQKSTDYNIIDVDLIDDLNVKLGLIELNSTITYKAKCNHEDTLGTVKIWESYLYNELSHLNLCLPPRKKNKKEKYPGAYVKKPIAGIYHWTVSFDFASLYPMIMKQYNISPETFVDHLFLDVDQEKVDDCFFDENFKNPNTDYILTASGNYFRKDKIGVIPQIIDKLFPERKDYKNKKKQLEKEKEKTKTKKYDEEISQLENQQMAIKILMNSLYGAMGNKYFIFYDIRFARAITLSAQLATRSVENYLMKSDLKTKYNIESRYIDTDSIFLDINSLIQKCLKANKLKNNENKISDFIDKFADKKITPLINIECERVSKMMGSFNYMDMKREKICINGLWTEKKKYAVNVIDDEGTRYKTPKLKVTGIEIVRSSTPACVKPFLRQIINRILSGENVYKYINSCKTEYENFSPEEIAFPRSANNIDKWIDKRKMWSKGTPIGVKSAIIYNKFIEENDLELSFPRIHSGEKIKFIYLKQPNVLYQDVVGFIRRMPDELKKSVDRNLMWEKSFMKVVRDICEKVGAKYKKEQVDINNFF